MTLKMHPVDVLYDPLEESEKFIIELIFGWSIFFENYTKALSF
jgi:hypothetical protein